MNTNIQSQKVSEKKTDTLTLTLFYSQQLQKSIRVVTKYIMVAQKRRDRK